MSDARSKAIHRLVRRWDPTRLCNAHAAFHHAGTHYCTLPSNHAPLPHVAVGWGENGKPVVWFDEPDVKLDLDIDPYGRPPSVPEATSDAAKRHSEDAACAMIPRAGTMRRKALEFLRERGERGATDQEAEDALGWTHVSYSPRRVELAKGNWIRDSLNERPTASGRMASVWVVTERIREL